MKQVEVFDGNEFKRNIPPLADGIQRCCLSGTDSMGQKARIQLTDDQFSKHLLFVGGIGSGKTNALFQIVAQLRKTLSMNDVMIVFDTKGDFYNQFYQKGDIVISNDNKAVGINGADYWNIFNEISQGERLEEDITEITKTLFYERLERSNQPFFPNAAKDLLAAILTHFSRSNNELQADNERLRTFLDRSTTAELREMLSAHPDLRAITSYISDDRSPQTQGVISEMQQLAREILLGNFKKPGTLSIRQLVRQKGGRVIFIEYDLGIGGMLTPVYRLLFDMAIKEALCRSKSEGNVWFVADEFRLLPHLQHVDDAINFGRSLGVKFMVGVQNVDQVYEAYGPSRSKSILSGFLTTIAFRVNDSETRDFIKSIHGTNRKKETYSSAIQSRGIVESIRDAHVIEDWDIANLKIGEAVVGFPGKEPFRFQFDLFKADK